MLVRGSLTLSNVAAMTNVLAMSCSGCERVGGTLAIRIERRELGSRQTELQMPFY
jgi:hypothetical protein